MKRIIPIILLSFFMANFAFATTIIPIQLKPSLFERISLKIQTCKWHLSCYFSPQIGTTITTILGTDTVKDALKTTVNNNFTALNNGKIETSTTTLPLLTTLANLSTVGTITSGTWNASTLTVAYGGTGSTTLSANQVLLGNGTTMLKTVAGFGTSGQFLTSAGSGAAPTWQTSSVNQADNYAWTGTHSWTGAASSTLFGILNTLYVGTTATSTVQGSTSGTSQMQGYLNVLGSSGTSTVSSNLVVSNNASTTNLTVSGTLVLPSFYATSSAAVTTSQTQYAETTIIVYCLAGHEVISGGFHHAEANGIHGNAITRNYRNDAGSWIVGTKCQDAACPAGTITAYAICANVQ